MDPTRASGNTASRIGFSNLVCMEAPPLLSLIIRKLGPMRRSGLQHLPFTPRRAPALRSESCSGAQDYYIRRRRSTIWQEQEGLRPPWSEYYPQDADAFLQYKSAAPRYQSVNSLATEPASSGALYARNLFWPVERSRYGAADLFPKRWATTQD